MKKNLLEVEIFEGEMDLNNASGFDTGTEDVLFSRLVFLGSKSVKIIQEAVAKVFLMNNMIGSLEIFVNSFQ